MLARGLADPPTRSRRADPPLLPLLHLLLHPLLHSPLHSLLHPLPRPLLHSPLHPLLHIPPHPPLHAPLHPPLHPFYKWDGDEALMRAIHEADRHLLVGALEYVPDDEVAWVAATSVVHPWVVVPQAGGKWRLCHDYSVGTNKHVRSAPSLCPRLGMCAVV